MTKEVFRKLSEELKMDIAREIAYEYAVFVPKDEETALHQLRYSAYLKDKIFFDKDVLKNAEYGRIVPYDVMTQKIEKMVDSYYREFELNVNSQKMLESYSDRGERFKKYFKDSLENSKSTTKNAVREELFKQLRRENDAKSSIKAVASVIEKRTASVERLCESLSGQMERLMVLWDYEDMGYSQYRISAVGENCDDCQDIDGAVFKITDAVIGKNLAPFHPNCNCAIDILDSAGNVVFTIVKDEKDKDENEDDKSFGKYLKSSLKQLFLGNYTEDVNLLGTILQVASGLIGIDLPADIRDLFYDVTNLELSKEHIMQTVLDTTALLPIVGGIKYADEAGALIKSGAKYGDEAADTIENILKNKNISDAAKIVQRSEKGTKLLSKVTNPKLKNTIKELYRPGAKVGDGGLGSAIRKEKESGQLIGGKSHIQKGIERLRNLENILSKETLTREEKKITEDLISELNDALGGK